MRRAVAAAAESTAMLRACCTFCTISFVAGALVDLAGDSIGQVVATVANGTHMFAVLFAFVSKSSSTRLAAANIHLANAILCYVVP